MSRIGRKPIPVPAGVKIAVQAGKIDVQGPKGKLTFAIPHGITFEQKDGILTALRATEEHRALHGLARALVANAVHGVTSGFKKELDIVGVGYRAELKGKNTVVFSLGYSHPIEFPLPTGIEVAVDPKQTRLTVSGVDRQKVGQISADMRAHCRGRHRVGVGRRKRLGEEPREGPRIRGDEGKHGFLEAFLQRDGLFPQAKQELPGRVGVIERAMWPWLAEAKLCRQQRQAVAWRRRHQDPGHVQRIEYLGRVVPEAGGDQKVNVEASPMTDGLPARKKCAQLGQRCLLGGGSTQLFGFDPGEPEHGFRH